MSWPWGRGWGRYRETEELVRRLVLQTELPLVLDADGLSAFAGQADVLKGRAAPLVLTPPRGRVRPLEWVGQAADYRCADGCGPRLCRRIRRDARVEGSADCRSVARWAGGGQLHRQSGYGHSRVGRRADRDHCRADGPRARRGDRGLPWGLCPRSGPEIGQSSGWGNGGCGRAI